MSTTAECESEWLSEVANFNTVVYFSLGLTACSFFATLFLKAHFQTAPNRGWKYFGSLSAIKIILGILLFTVFTPTCPAGCNCGSYQPTYVYPAIVLAVGIIWALRGKKYYELDCQGVEGHDANVIAGTKMKVNSHEVI
mmetsp:Transcript_2155/g.3400  ORF Transcript_2155/g.3400 Transcript_2155/m.3400 type:complete len:139 (-) Transcript_2155:645-1061(-)